MSLGLGNPVPGKIHPLSWKRPAGNLDFRVTQTFGCTGVAAERPFGDCAHFHRAIDIGNGKAGAPVYAARAGKIAYVGTNDGSLNIVINHGGGVYTGYAHLADEFVMRGQAVAEGHMIGRVGSSGATAAHLHFALKTGITTAMLNPYAGFWGDVRGKWADPWVNLAQNGG